MEGYDSLTGKCCMANYCKYSLDHNHCTGNKTVVENCVYLKAIEEIALLATELVKKEN